MISINVTYLTLAEVAVLFDTWALWELAKFYLVWEDATGGSDFNLSGRRQFSFGGSLELNLPHII